MCLNWRIENSCRDPYPQPFLRKGKGAFWVKFQRYQGKKALPSLKLEATLSVGRKIIAEPIKNFQLYGAFLQTII